MNKNLNVKSPLQMNSPARSLSWVVKYKDSTKKALLWVKQSRDNTHSFRRDTLSFNLKLLLKTTKSIFWYQRSVVFKASTNFLIKNLPNFFWFFKNPCRSSKQLTRNPKPPKTNWGISRLRSKNPHSWGWNWQVKIGK